jgi:hypothetical protein
VSTTDEGAAEVVEALERTKQAGAAFCTFEWRLSRPGDGRSRRGGLLPWLGRRLAAKLGQARQGYGVVDIGAARAAIDFGHFAIVVQAGQEWSGRSGRSLASLRPGRSGRLQPLWLFDLMSGVTEARPVGVEEAGGRACRRLAARADAVVAATHTDFALPSKTRLAELRAVPFEVWIDADGVIRRARSPDTFGMTLELKEFGVATPEWTALPTFRSDSIAES